MDGQNSILVFRIPGDPIGKGRPRFGRGRTYTDDKTRSFESLVEVCAFNAGLRTIADDTPLGVQVGAFFRIPKSSKKTSSGDFHTIKPDADNVAKAVLDGLKTFFDDKMVAKMVVIKRYTNEPPYIEVRIWKLLM